MDMAGPIRGGVWLRATVKDESRKTWAVDAWAVRRGGRLVVGEIRIFPLAGAGKVGRAWELDPEKVPRRGLSGRILKRVPVGRFIPQLMAELSQAASSTPRSFLRQRHRAAMSGKVLPPNPDWLLAMFPGCSDLAERPRPRRAVGRDDRFYARLSFEYIKLIAGGSRKPVKSIADRRHEKPAHVRDLLHESRERGLLTPGESGKSCGALTRRALAVLGEPQRKARRRRGPW
jgi:hypothetical protein